MLTLRRIKKLCQSAEILLIACLKFTKHCASHLVVSTTCSSTCSLSKLLANYLKPFSDTQTCLYLVLLIRLFKNPTIFTSRIFWFTIQSLFIKVLIFSTIFKPENQTSINLILLRIFIRLFHLLESLKGNIYIDKTERKVSVRIKGFKRATRFCTRAFFPKSSDSSI